MSNLTAADQAFRIDQFKWVGFVPLLPPLAPQKGAFMPKALFAARRRV